MEQLTPIPGHWSCNRGGGPRAMGLEGMKQPVHLGPFKIWGPGTQRYWVLSSFLSPWVQLLFLTPPLQKLLLGRGRHRSSRCLALCRAFLTGASPRVPNWTITPIWMNLPEGELCTALHLGASSICKTTWGVEQQRIVNVLQRKSTCATVLIKSIFNVSCFLFWSPPPNPFPQLPPPLSKPNANQSSSFRFFESGGREGRWSLLSQRMLPVLTRVSTVPLQHTATGL